jgi:hypothetical protein
MLPFVVGFFGVTLVVLMIWSAVLVQVKGSQRSFQPSMKLPIAAMRSLTEVKVPRRMAWRVMIPRSG